MTDQYNKSNQMTFEGMTDATSSQALDCGNTPCNSQDGATSLCGREAAPASLSVPQGSEKGDKMKDICGRCGSALSVNPDRLLCLENRCERQFAIIGGTMWPMTWKVLTTPRGRKLGQLAVSVRPTSEKDYGLWATPNTMDHLPQRGVEAARRQFTTTRNGRTAPANLREQVNPNAYPAALWATPNASDHRDRGSYNDPCIQRRIAKGKQVGLTMIAQGTGKMHIGSTAQMGSKGSLNPAFPCWLMGLPNEWALSIAQGMASYRKSPQDSYKPLKESE